MDENELMDKMSEAADQAETVDEKTEQLWDFLHCHDFMNIGQAVMHNQWTGAMMTCRRLEQNVKKYGLVGFDRAFVQLRTAIMQKNTQMAQQAMTIITQKRVQLWKQVEAERNRYLRREEQNE